MATTARNRRLEPAYKQHSVVDDERGVILDVEVTTGELNEGQIIESRIDATVGVDCPDAASRAVTLHRTCDKLPVIVFLPSHFACRDGSSGGKPLACRPGGIPGRTPPGRPGTRKADFR